MTEPTNHPSLAREGFAIPDANSAAEVRPIQSGLLARIRPMQGWAGLGEFLGISAQLSLLLILIYLAKVEQAAGFLRILPLVFAGFLVHAALPLRYRVTFFLVLSLLAIGIVLGPGPGAVLVTLGLGLLGLCHLPVAFSTRVVLLLVAGGALAALRSGWAPAPLMALPAMPALPSLVLPVLGSMFMFRLIIYLYDLRHEERERGTGRAGPLRGTPTSVWMRLSYFFLLPNACFLLFPVVDYRTYRRSYYNRPPNEIYQRGVWWICLGLVHLLLYRLVYHYLVPSPEEVQGLGGVVRFMTASYLIYLRVVGLFHVIVGVLCLFGFDLPPAHRFFFFASGFTDFWRRARIDWKDFMVKVFYYPALVPSQRRLGTMPALVLTTVAVFVVTWLLHSYQWFWLRGEFPFSRADAVFWTVFGGCVLVNSLLEAKGGRKRSQGWALGPAVVHALKVLGLFIFLCVLWSYWSSPSFTAWLGLVSAAGDSGPAAYALLVGALAAAVGMGVLAQFVAARMASRKVRARAPAGVPGPAPFVWRSMAVGVTVALLLLVGIPAARGSFGAQPARLASVLSTNQLNALDQEREDRSYYETLLDTRRSTVALAVSVGERIEEMDVAEDDAGLFAQPEPQSAPLSDIEPPDAAPLIAQPERAATGPAVAGTEGADTSTANGLELKDMAPASEESIQKRNTDARAEPLATSDPVNDRAIPFGRRTRRYERTVDDLLMWENAPNFSGGFKGAPIRTNQWGMRDKEYSLARSPRTYRIALLGSSMTLGAGVPVEQTMEWLLEERLNREGPGTPGRNYEILDFSVGGYCIMQNVVVAERKAVPFAPNAILVSVFSVEASRLTNYLSNVVRAKLAVPYPYVQQKLREAGVDASMDQFELRRRLGPIGEDLVVWSYKQIVEIGRQRGVPVIGIVLPEPVPRAGRDIDHAVRLAASAGIPLLDLRGIYDGHTVDSLKLEGQDPHWNVPGHKLVSERLYELLRANDARALKLGFGSRGESGKNPEAAGQQAGAAPADAAPLGAPGGRRAPFIRMTGGVLGYELVPSFTGSFKEAPLHTNRWGMRDKDYELKPPPETYRIALLGSSFTFGGGVPAEQTIEARLEDRLNREGPGAPDRHYEVLNFSVMRYGVLQHLVVAEKKAFAFEPNALLLVIHSLDQSGLINNLISLLQQNAAIEYPYLRQKLQEAGVRAGMEETELRRRIAPIATDLLQWSYQRISEIGRAHRVPVVGIVFPEPRVGREEDLAAVAALASTAGIPLVDLRGVYDGRSVDSLKLPRDAHLNPLGHQVVADRLYELLRANDARTLKLGFGLQRRSGQPAPPVGQPLDGARTHEKPTAGQGGMRRQPLIHFTGDALGHELAPSFDGRYKGAPFRTNRWGMRDKEYELKPPAGTYRVALLGSSFTMGAGVPVEQTMEWLLEDRLNREGPAVPNRRYEILNFSVGGYGVFQNLVTADKKVFPFSPDAVLLVIHSLEETRLIDQLVSPLRDGVVIEYPYVRQKLKEAGVRQGMEELELRRRLAPVALDLVRWSYQHISEICRDHHVPLVGIIFPEPREGREEDLTTAAELGSSAGIPLLDLRGVYDGYSPDSVKLRRDPHLNALGHKLVADRLYELLRANDARALKLGFRVQMESGQSASPGRPGSADAAVDDDAPMRGPPPINEPFLRLTKDPLMYELVPSFTGSFKGAPLLTNRWGMRDKEYELIAPQGTYRIALLGSSFTFGGGVPAEQTIEWLLEDRLNREGPGAPDRHYEILNFSVMRYGVLQHLIVTEKKVFTFEPNAVLVVIHTIERNRMITNLLSLLRQGIAIEYPYMRQKLGEAGVRPQMEETELRRRLAPIALDLVKWSYQRIAEICRANRVPVVGILFREPRALSEKSVAPIAGLASEAGIPVVDLKGVWDGDSLSSFRLPLDAHLNPRGHRVVADRLYELLRANDARVLKLGFGGH